MHWPVRASNNLEQIWSLFNRGSDIFPEPLQCCLCSSGVSLTVEWELKQEALLLQLCTAVPLSSSWPRSLGIPGLHPPTHIQHPGSSSRISLLVPLLSKTTSHFGNIPFSSPALLSRMPRPQLSLCSLCTKAQQVRPSQ